MSRGPQERSVTPREQEPAGRPAAVRWFYKTDFGKSGPVDEESLRQLLRAGDLPEATPVWREGLPGWIPAGDLPEFVQAIAAGRAATGGAAGRRRRAGLMLGLLVLVPAAWYAVSWLRQGFSAATVSGVVTVDSKPVAGGSVILAPVNETKSLSAGKPAVATVAEDGTFVLRLTAGGGGLARRFWVRYSPPVLPPMSEEEAIAATPPYLGLVPKSQQVDVAAGRNRIDVELVPATPR